jgi:hypothetical protein
LADHAFNLLISNRIGGLRRVPDTRNKLWVLTSDVWVPRRCVTWLKAQNGNRMAGSAQSLFCSLFFSWYHVSASFLWKGVNLFLTATTCPQRLWSSVSTTRHVPRWREPFILFWSVHLTSYFWRLFW